MPRRFASALLVMAVEAWALVGCQPAPPIAPPLANTPATSAPTSPPAASTSASAVATEVSPIEPTSGARARTCPALPAVRPADLVIGVATHNVPHGLDIEDHRAELSETEQACRANLAPGTAPTYTCLNVSAAELDALWRDFRKRSFTAMTSHGGAGSPHYGGRFLWLRWGGQYACEVGDSSGAAIDAAYDRDFFELKAAVEAVGRKYL